MILCIQILHAAAVAETRRQVENLPFIDGRTTAGRLARAVKHNLQADSSDAATQATKTFLTDHITRNDVVRLAAVPRRFSPIVLSRYDCGMEYGTHVDNALMGDLRSDLSFTLFLSAPGDYDGGELIIENSLGEQEFKPDAGSLILYPSTSLHRVAPVTRGVRYAAVGWIQSFIRDAHRREILFDLETARARLRSQQGDADNLALLSKSCTNLLRLWAET